MEKIRLEVATKNKRPVTSVIQKGKWTHANALFAMKMQIQSMFLNTFSKWHV